MKKFILNIQGYFDRLCYAFLRFRRKPFNDSTLYKKLSEKEKVAVIYG